MSFSAFYAVRFSPAPELGEWLNVAVVGEGITESKAGIVVTDAMLRIEAAFGVEAVDRVKAICTDLTALVAAMAIAHDRGEETQPITMAMRDQALSLSFSEQIVVFEGTFEDALANIAKKYLYSMEGDEDQTAALNEQSSQQSTVIDEQDIGLGKIANSIQNRLARFSREIFPAGVAKSLEQSQKAIESIVHGPDIDTVLVIGGGGHLGSALLPQLLAKGKRVRLIDPSVSGTAVVEVLNPNIPRGISLTEVAKRAGVSLDSVTHVLSGATEKLSVSPKKAEQIRDIAGKLGYRGTDAELAYSEPADIASAMEGVDVVIYIPATQGEQVGATTRDSDEVTLTKAHASTAKARGVKRFVFAGTYQAGERNHESLAKELNDLGDELFTTTIMQLGELYGHARAAQWFGDLHDATGQLQARSTVNHLTAQAVLNGRVTGVETGPRSFLHVEDAVASIMAVVDGPREVVNGQTYSVGSEDQIRTVSEIAFLIQQQAPNAEFLISLADGEMSFAPEALTKIHDELGYSPSFTLEEGISQLVVALQDGSFTSYMSLRSWDPALHLASEAPPEKASEIQWESLTYASIQVEGQDASSSQSIDQH